MLSVIVLNVVMLNVDMLSVVAPIGDHLTTVCLKGPANMKKFIHIHLICIASYFNKLSIHTFTKKKSSKTYLNSQAVCSLAVQDVTSLGHLQPNV